MRRILVATDFSTRSDRALRRAILLSRESGASITLVHVVDEDQPGYLISRQLGAATEFMAQSAETLAEVDAITTETMVTTGDAFAGILRAADETQPDLIVVGPHRRQLLDMFLGTTAERTIRRSRHPVLMANAAPGGPYARCLLATDLKDASRQAIQVAKDLGFLNQGAAIAMHLFDRPGLGMMRRSMMETEAIDHYVETEHRDSGEQFRAFLSETGLTDVEQVLKPLEGSAAAAIISGADRHRADLIVLGTRRRKGLKRIFIGSVAEEVLLDAQCDVLVVPLATEQAGSTQ